MAISTVAIDTTASESVVTDTITPNITPPTTTAPNPQAHLGANPQEIKDQIFDRLMLDPGLAPSRKPYARAVDSNTTLRPLASWANFARVNRKFHASANRWLQDTHELVLAQLRWRKLVEYLDDCWTQEPVFIGSTKQALAFEGRGMAVMTIEITGPVDTHAPLVAFVAESKYLDKFYTILRLVMGQVVSRRQQYASIAPGSRAQVSAKYPEIIEPGLRFAVRLSHIPRKRMSAERKHNLLRPLQSIIADSMDFTIEGDVCDRPHADAVTLMLYGGFSDISESISSPIARLWDYVTVLSKCKVMVDEDIANGRERAALAWVNRIAGWDFARFIDDFSTFWHPQQPTHDILAALTLLQYDLSRTCTYLHLRLDLPETRITDPAMFALRNDAPAVTVLGGGWLAPAQSHR
ncbi:hypothetical protein LTR95_001287 [Oleoguttula sp. CCFEE 5521]